MRASLAGLFVLLLSVTFGCGASQEDKPTTPVTLDEGWPAFTPWPLDAATVEQALASPDGTPIRLVGYLLAVKLPCPVCNVGGPQAPREEVAGRTSRPRGPAAPGCLPCPDPAATVGDTPPHSPEARADMPRVRVVGLAGALQPRHVGRSFLFIGVVRRNGANEPEVDVSELRAVGTH